MSNLRIAMKIRQAMTTLKITKDVMVNATGISMDNICRYVMGESVPDKNDAALIASFLGLDPAQLIEQTDANEKHVSKNYSYPIVLGCYDTPDKCVIMANKPNKHKIAICRLNKDSKYEFCDNNVAMDDIEGILHEIWFCKKESLHSFIEVLQHLEESWV